MKTFLFITLLSLTVFTSYSQNFSQLADYEFASSESYKTEEDKVLLCANYLFNTPSGQAEFNRTTSKQYILKWMMGTPDHTFEVGEQAMKLTKGSDELFALYMAAMTKVVLDNDGEALSNEDIYNRSEALLVDYCSKPENGIKPSKKIKKLLKSKKG